MLIQVKELDRILILFRCKPLCYSPITSLAVLSPFVFVTGTKNGCIYINDLKFKPDTNPASQKYIGHIGKVKEIKISKNGQYIVSIDNTNAIFIWDFFGSDYSADMKPIVADDVISNIEDSNNNNNNELNYLQESNEEDSNIQSSEYNSNDESISSDIIKQFSSTIKPLSSILKSTESQEDNELDGALFSGKSNNTNDNIMDTPSENSDEKEILEDTVIIKKEENKLNQDNNISLFEAIGEYDKDIENKLNLSYVYGYNNNGIDNIVWLSDNAELIYTNNQRIIFHDIENRTQKSILCEGLVRTIKYCKNCIYIIYFSTCTWCCM